VLGAAIAVAAAMATPAAAGAGSQQDQPAGEIGVTEDAIRIAVIADVDNPVRPGLFEGSVEGVRAAAEYINDHGGLAGRNVEVDFIDSHLSADDARDAIIRACEQDFALVGTTALFMNNIEPMVSCVDAAGNATGIPDIPEFQTEIAHQCSPVSYPVIVVGIDCNTVDDPKPRFTVRMGQIDYFKRRFKDLHGPFILAGDLKSTVNAFLPTVTAVQKAGVKSDGEVRVSGLDPQAAYTPIVQQIKQDGSSYVGFGVDYRADVFLRREAALQSATSVKVWDCTLACYDARLIEEGGDDVEGQFTNMPFIPFEDANQNKQISRYLNAVGGIENASAFSVQGWLSTLLFRDVVERVVEADGEDGLTRARFLEEIGNYHDFDADGLVGPTDIGGRKVSQCFVVMEVKNGKWTRAFPKKKGTLSCEGRLTSVRVDLE
jgi:ABC-type branched-subunit amino acid transport system substrate-binding protein